MAGKSRKSAPVSVIDHDTGALDFVSTGCRLLDCVMGGGYPLGRVVNIVGDKSTGKTLLAIESSANFASVYPRGLIRYNEAEAAFDKNYARNLGAPIERISFKENCNTVEELFQDLEKFVGKVSTGYGFYILDSLDALSDKSEMERNMEEGTYGAAKAKQMSQLFRRLTRQLNKAYICFTVISQVRESIGVTFGRKYSRSGGKALDFYATHVLYLAQIKTLYRTRGGIRRPTGIRVRVRCEKNKISLPMRECDVDLVFGYGIDDVSSHIRWLLVNGFGRKIDLRSSSSQAEGEQLARSIYKLNDEDFRVEKRKLAATVAECWDEVESRFKPPRRKYA